MRYVALLLVAGGVYLALARHLPVAPVSAAAAHPAGSAQGTDFLKEPLDRTHQVLDQARTRTQDPALQ